MPDSPHDVPREDRGVTPANERLRRPGPNVIDQRQQQIDPAGRQRHDDNARPDTNRKQPGGSATTHQDQKDPAP
jgi:hypothetical protein